MIYVFQPDVLRLLDIFQPGEFKELPINFYNVVVSKKLIYSVGEPVPDLGGPAPWTTLTLACGVPDAMAKIVSAFRVSIWPQGRPGIGNAH